MSINIGKAALIIWLFTIGIFGWYVVKGNVAQKSGSERAAIVLDYQDRELVLDEMRAMLQSTQQIIEGLANNNRAQVINAAKAAGMGSAIDLDPVFLAKLPLDFKTLGFSMHSDMDALSKRAINGASDKELAGMLANTLNKCVGCHSAWQLKVK